MFFAYETVSTEGGSAAFATRRQFIGVYHMENILNGKKPICTTYSLAEMHATLPLLVRLRCVGTRKCDVCGVDAC